MIFCEYLFIVLCFVGIFQFVACLEISCGTMGIDVGLQEEHRELRCICSSVAGQQVNKESFSEIFNPQLISFSSYLRPVSQKITHITLVNCKTINIILDLDKLNKDASDLSDVSFEDIENLNVEFQSIVEPRMKLVFTNILYNQLSGTIHNSNSTMEMFFRQLQKVDRDQTTVIFSNLNIQADIGLLNFQDIGHVRVIDSYFSNIDTLDILHSTKCHTSYRDPEVKCSKEDLFYSSTFSTRSSNANSPSYKGRRPRLEADGSTLLSSHDLSPSVPVLYKTISETAMKSSAKSVTASPLFIVPMVLFFGLTFFMIISLAFLRYKQRNCSPGSAVKEMSQSSILEEERYSQISSIAFHQRQQSPVFVHQHSEFRDQTAS